MTSVLVRRAGPSTTVQDLGRPGWAHLGVPVSGAADSRSLRRANVLVGNDPGHAALEATLLGPELEFEADAVLAVTGAECALRLDGRPAPWDAPVQVPAGSLLRVGPLRRGARAYVAFAGGVDVAPVLGSRSTDVLSGLGPEPVRDGDRLPLGPVLSPRAPRASRGATPRPTPLAAAPVLRISPGPRRSWFGPGAVQALTASSWRVRPESNRVGVRLEGPALPRTRPGELPSEGLITGAVQVPPVGGPVIFLADRPVTGGYPVLAVVEEADLPLVAQARPGSLVRFAWLYHG